MGKQKLDTYLNLCTQVYDLSKPKPPKEAYSFYRSYVAKANGSVLEPMCGTGRFLLPLVEEGFAVDGFDASQDMLEALNAKATLKSLKPTVWQGFVETLELSKKYNLVFIPSGSIGLIIDLQAAKGALKILYDLLNEGGTLVFEAETLRSVPSSFGVWNGSIWRRSDGKMILLNTLDLPLENSIGTTLCRYELIDGHQITHTEIEEFRVRHYDPDAMIEILREIGFKSCRKLKAFDAATMPGTNDNVVVFECKK